MTYDFWAWHGIVVERHKKKLMPCLSSGLSGTKGTEEILRGSFLLATLEIIGFIIPLDFFDKKGILSLEEDLGTGLIF